MSEEDQQAQKAYDYIHHDSPAFVEIGSISIPAKNGKPATTVPYMDANNRARWALSEFAKMAAKRVELAQIVLTRPDVEIEDAIALLRSSGWQIIAQVEELQVFTETVREDGQDTMIISPASYCRASCVIRDPFGSETRDEGFCDRQSWKAFVEKALTKAKARALQSLGFGTAFAIDMDDDEMASIAQDVSNAADGGARISPPKPATQAASRPVAQQPSASPTPVAASTPATTATPKPVAEPVAQPKLTDRNRQRLIEIGILYPTFLPWLKDTQFDGRYKGDKTSVLTLFSNADVEMLVLNKDEWVKQWEAHLATQGKSLEQLIRDLDAEKRAAGSSYKAWAQTQGVTVIEPKLVEQPKAEEVEDDPDPEGSDFDEEVEAPLDEPAVESLVPAGYSQDAQFPNDPESPTRGQIKYLGELITECGGLSNNSVMLLMQELGTKYPCKKPEHVRKQRTPNGDGVLPEGKKPGIATCWTASQFDEAIKAFKNLKAGMPQAAAA